MELPGDLHESSFVSRDGAEARLKWGKVGEVEAKHHNSLEKCAVKERKGL